MDVLIAKNKKNKLATKVAKFVSRGYAVPKYQKVIDIYNFKDLALFFHDLEVFLSAPVEKAFAEFKRKQTENPFW